MSPLDDPWVFRAVLESLPVGIYFVDRERRIRFWNEGAEKISGFLRQEVTGRRCRDEILMHCDEQNVVLCGDRCPLAETMRDGHMRRAEAYLRHRSGHRLPVWIWAVPIRDPQGAIIGAAESFQQRTLRPDPDRRHDGEGASNRDVTTGLPNRGLLESLLEEALRLSLRHLIPFSLLRAQVDHLQQFQQRHGSEAADEILQVVARTMQNALRPSDVVGRWTRDQFLVLVRSCNQTGLQVVAERVRRVVRLSSIPWWGDQLSVTVSVGATTFKTGDTLDAVLERTDKALQQSAGRGDCVAVCHE